MTPEPFSVSPSRLDKMLFDDCDASAVALDVRDLWNHVELGTSPLSFSTLVPGHGVCLLKVTGAGHVPPRPSQTSRWCDFELRKRRHQRVRRTLVDLLRSLNCMSTSILARLGCASTSHTNFTSNIASESGWRIHGVFCHVCVPH